VEQAKTERCRFQSKPIRICECLLESMDQEATALSRNEQIADIISRLNSTDDATLQSRYCESVKNDAD